MLGWATYVNGKLLAENNNSNFKKLIIKNNSTKIFKAND